ncbi:hypothetical protein NRB_48750 [Novosphingobium sp. 11B]
MAEQELPSDLDNLWNVLRSFRVEVISHLTDDIPLPERMAQQLRKALEIVEGVIDDLRTTCGFKEAGYTVYMPEDLIETLRGNEEFPPKGDLQGDG